MSSAPFVVRAIDGIGDLELLVVADRRDGVAPRRIALELVVGRKWNRSGLIARVERRKTPEPEHRWDARLDVLLDALQDLFARPILRQRIVGEILQGLEVVGHGVHELRGLAVEIGARVRVRPQ
jgi:hypothetical protein